MRIHEVVHVMRCSTDEGTVFSSVRHTGQPLGTIGPVLREAGATAEQAAAAARRLGWCSGDSEDWADVLPRGRS